VGVIVGEVDTTATALLGGGLLLPGVIGVEGGGGGGGGVAVNVRFEAFLALSGTG